MLQMPDSNKGFVSAVLKRLSQFPNVDSIDAAGWLKNVGKGFAFAQRTACNNSSIGHDADCEPIKAICRIGRGQRENAMTKLRRADGTGRNGLPRDVRDVGAVEQLIVPVANERPESDVRRVARSLQLDLQF